MYNFETITGALRELEDRGRIGGWSTTYTQSGTVRLDITNNAGLWKRFTLGEAAAFVWGVLSQMSPEERL